MIFVNNKIFPIFLMVMVVTLIFMPIMQANELRTNMGDGWYHYVKTKTINLLVKENRHGRFLFDVKDKADLYDNISENVAALCYLRGNSASSVHAQGFIATPFMLYFGVYLPLHLAYAEYYIKCLPNIGTLVWTRSDPAFLTAKIFNEIVYKRT